jgi:hypothetical protein
MLGSGYIPSLAEEIRNHVRSQDWRAFLQYDGLGQIGSFFEVRDGALIVVPNNSVAIRCADGEMINTNYPPMAQPVHDAAVVNLYTSPFVYDTGLIPAHMLQLWLPE